MNLNYSTEKLALYCKKRLSLQEITRIDLRFADKIRFDKPPQNS